MSTVKGTAYFVVDESGRAISTLPEADASAFVYAGAKRALLGDQDAALREVIVSPRDPSEALNAINQLHRRHFRAVPFLDYLAEQKGNIWLFENLPIPLKIMNDPDIMEELANIAASPHSHSDKKVNMKSRYLTLTGEKLPESMALTMVRKPRADWFAKIGDWSKALTSQSPVRDIIQAMSMVLEQKQRRGTVNAGFMTHLANNMMRLSQASTPTEAAQRMLSMSLLYRREHGIEMTHNLKECAQSAQGVVDSPFEFAGAETGNVSEKLEQLTEGLSDAPGNERLLAALDFASKIDDDDIEDVTIAYMNKIEVELPTLKQDPPSMRGKVSVR
ncbi:hypothetical protein [Alteromonas sp. 14N.309.X.WAT.G.H12]|uniref:hypothetical protein n=1 Tax=Alteromonas sp. 14N.309.X.WAT.G.H12 TaxID=3120824 RepID=UPI002FD16D36